MFYRFLPFNGPSRFTWKDPDTGREFQENDKISLMNRITAYRAANNLEPIEHLSFVLESYWCQQPENKSNCYGVADTPRGTLGYLKGGIALLKTLMYKSFVSQQVADSRSEQCAGCKYNVFPDKGAFLHWSDKVAEAAIGERKSSRHNDLGNCGVCSCPLRAKVFYNGKVEKNKEWQERMKEVDCWQLKLMD